MTSHIEMHREYAELGIFAGYMEHEDMTEKVKRQTFELLEADKRKLSLYGNPKDIWDFWGSIAFAMGLDPKTIIAEAGKFSGLPLGHGKQWCYPQALQARTKPNYY